MKFNVSHLDKHTFINAYLMPYEMYAVAKLKHTKLKRWITYIMSLNTHLYWQD